MPILTGNNPDSASPGLTGNWADNCIIRADGDQDNASFQGSVTHIDDNGQISIGQTSTPCSLLELWDDDAHPILSITAAHATDYDPQIQFRTDATDTVKFSMGVDGADDKFKIYSGSGIGGTSEFVLDASGNLGIGEDSTETLVELTHASPFMTFHCSTESDAADSGMSKLLFKREQSGGEETTCAAIYAAHDGAADDQKGYIALYTNDGSDDDTPTERVKIDSVGLMTINNPDSGPGLKVGRVAGVASISPTDDAPGGYMIIDCTGSNILGLNYYAGGDVIIAGTGGSVGIGVQTTPKRLFTIAGANPIIALHDTGSNLGWSIWDGDTYLAFYEYTNTSWSTGATRMAIRTGTENIGINTIAPDKALEINKSTGGEIRLTYNDANGSATDYCDFVTDANGGLTVTTVDSDGAAGHINLNPDGVVNISTDLDVVGDLTAGTIQADNGFTGSFTNGDGDTVTVVGGVITDVS